MYIIKLYQVARTHPAASRFFSSPQFPLADLGPFRVLEVALRDTMVTAYAAALEGQSDAHPPEEFRQEMGFGQEKRGTTVPHGTGYRRMGTGFYGCLMLEKERERECVSF